MKVQLSNVGIIKDCNLEFTPGINLIIGSSGSGKSTLINLLMRFFDIKDYGHLIPGHGGIMDRFDSVIVTAPMIYFLFRILIAAVR